MAISIAGTITTIVIGTRKALKKDAQATGIFAKAVYNLGKKLGPLLAPILNIIAQAITWGTKGLARLSKNPWLLALAVTWFIYDQYKQQRKKLNVHYYIPMNRTEIQLKPGFQRSQMASIKGDRTRHVMTMNPNKASPGEELYIDILKLKPDSCLVPGSMHLLFDLKISNTKTHFLNNLSRLLQKRLHIRLARETVYDNNGESLYGVHKYLYKSKTQRANMIEYGIASGEPKKAY